MVVVTCMQDGGEDEGADGSRDGDDEGADGGAGVEEGEALAPRKALRSDDPNHKSAEVLRCVWFMY
eukprot:scaffold92155_cov22-Tisochrysis_lutea.AAC.2